MLRSGYKTGCQREYWNHPSPGSKPQSVGGMTSRLENDITEEVCRIAKIHEIQRTYL